MSAIQEPTSRPAVTYEPYRSPLPVVGCLSWHHPEPAKEAPTVTMRVKFRTVSSSRTQPPRVHAVADGVAVSWRVCDGRPAPAAWRCAEHFRQQDCEHVLAVLGLLDDELRERVAPPISLRRQPVTIHPPGVPRPKPVIGGRLGINR